MTVQAQMLDLLRDIQRKTGIGIVLVSHDLAWSPASRIGSP